MNQLIRCINCNEIFLKTPFDPWPEYEFHPGLSSDSFRSIAKDDFQDFLKDHRGHRLEDLKIIEDSFVSEKPYLEPVKISYFKATNGKDRFVIKKFRESVDEPLRYQLILGDYSLKCTHVEIQSEAITQQLETEFKASPLPRVKISAFLKLYQHIAETIDINNLERIPEDSASPLEVYYKPDDVSLVYLLRNCRNIFNGQEYSDIEEFINHHKENSVLLLKATYKIQIKEKVKSEKEVVPAAILLEKKKFLEKE